MLPQGTSSTNRSNGMPDMRSSAVRGAIPDPTKSPAAWRVQRASRRSSLLHSFVARFAGSGKGPIANHCFLPHRFRCVARSARHILVRARQLEVATSFMIKHQSLPTVGSMASGAIDLAAHPELVAVDVGMARLTLHTESLVHDPDASGHGELVALIAGRLCVFPL